MERAICLEKLLLEGTCGVNVSERYTSASTGEHTQLPVAQTGSGLWNVVSGGPVIPFSIILKNMIIKRSESFIIMFQNIAELEPEYF